MLSDQVTDRFVAMLVELGQNSNPHSVKSLSKLTCNTHTVLCTSNPNPCQTSFII